MRSSSIAALSVALGLFLAVSGGPAVGQQKPPEEKSRMNPRSVTGTVKAMTDGGFVVEGKDPSGKVRDYAFVLDGGTRMEAPPGGGSPRALRQGDPVAVTYAERDGKIVAESVKLLSPKR